MTRLSLSTPIVALLTLTFSLSVLLAPAVAAPARGRPSQESTQESVIDALSEAIPLGKEAIRAIAKPILDTVTVTPQEEMAVGNQFYLEIKKRLGDKLDSNAVDVRYINAIGQALARNVRRKAIVYHFHVVEEDVLNAFAIPGGHVFIYRGLLTKVIQNEAQLAEVMGHEISHVDAEHTVDYIKPIKAASQFPVADVSLMIGSLVSKLLSTTYNEVQEAEADKLGTILMFKANYEPLEGAVVHRHLAEMDETAKPDPVTGLVDALFRTHPPSAKRAAAIEAQAKALHAQEPNRKTYIGADNYRKRTPLGAR